jgi:RIO kinase 1
MDTKKLFEYYNDLDDQGQYDVKHTGHHRAQYHERDRIPSAERQYLQHQDDSLRTFSTTYQAARFEEGWLLDSLGHFYEQQWISDVLGKIKAGKEASVYLCRSGVQVHAPLLAAKVYRPRMLRNLKNDQLYRMDRAVLDEHGNRILDLGMLKAQHKRSVYGEQIRHHSWIAYEFQSLKTLHTAGADVPQPYEMDENAILMSYIGDEASAAATLNTVSLDPLDVGPLYEQLLRNIGLMLTHGIVHGDLSAYNVLYWQGDITLIDFPQVVSPASHRSAWKIFNRDITRLCEYFTRQGLCIDPDRLAVHLWKSHGYRLRPEVPPALLDVDDPADRQYWQKGREAD